MTTRSNPMGIPPHCYDPSVGAGHVDRYIGTSFDIVYEVYKRLPDFPVMLNFVQHWIPIMTELEPKVHEIIDNLHPDIVEKHGQIEIWHSETVQNKVLAEQARDAAEGYRDAALGFRNEAEGFRDESESFRDQSKGYVQIVEQGFVDLKTELEGIYTPLTRTITAGTGLEGGGNLSANRTLSVKYGTEAGTAAQGNDSRIVNAVPNARRVNTGYGLTGGGALVADLDIAVKVGTTADTLAAGNDPRIVKGEEAHGWGNHASAGYATAASLATTEAKATGAMSHISTLEGQMTSALQRIAALEALNP